MGQLIQVVNNIGNFPVGIGINLHKVDRTACFDDLFSLAESSFQKVPAVGISGTGQVRFTDFKYLCHILLLLMFAGSASQLRKGKQGSIVIRLLGDFRNLFSIGDLPVLVYNEYRPGKKPQEGAACKGYTIIPAEFREAENRERYDIRKSLGFAEALVGKREIC